MMSNADRRPETASDDGRHQFKKNNTHKFSTINNKDKIVATD